METNTDWIVHICSHEDWSVAQSEGEYRAASLETEGFIHCSTPEQVLETANRYYAGASGLVLLWIDPEKVQSEIRWEPAHDEQYPHIYGPIHLDAVAAACQFTAEADGIFRRLPSRSEVSGGS